LPSSLAAKFRAADSGQVQWKRAVKQEIPFHSS
jgi:hypothetical protein